MPALRKLVKEAPQIVEAYLNGSTLRQIASTYSVSHVTIKNVLDRSGVAMRSRGRKRKEKVNPVINVNEEV